MKKEVYICDNCEAERNAENGWYAMNRNGWISIYPISQAEKDDFHLCGIACVIKKTSERLNEMAERERHHA